MTRALVRDITRELVREINYELIVKIVFKEKETGVVPDETIYRFNIQREYAEGIFDPYEDEAEVYVNPEGVIVDMTGTEGEEEEEALREMVIQILKA